MVAVDVLEVPMSPNGYHYLLVIQDYFTKWAEAIPMPDQKASRITAGFHTGFFEKGGKPSDAPPPPPQETVPITNVLTAIEYTFGKIIGVFEQRCIPFCCSICHFAAVYALKPPYYNTCADLKGRGNFRKGGGGGGGGGKSHVSLSLYESLITDEVVKLSREWVYQRYYKGGTLRALSSVKP